MAAGHWIRWRSRDATCWLCLMGRSYLAGQAPLVCQGGPAGHTSPLRGPCGQDKMLYPYKMVSDGSKASQIARCELACEMLF